MASAFDPTLFARQDWARVVSGIIGGAVPSQTNSKTKSRHSGQVSSAKAWRGTPRSPRQPIPSRSPRGLAHGTAKGRARKCAGPSYPSATCRHMVSARMIRQHHRYPFRPLITELSCLIIAWRASLDLSGSDVAAVSTRRQLPQNVGHGYAGRDRLVKRHHAVRPLRSVARSGELHVLRC